MNGKGLEAMKKDLSATEALALRNPLFIDLRSEDEFKAATIPGALNLPLFSNEEKELLGKVYREVGAAEARQLGLELAAPRLPGLIKTIGEKTRQQPVVIFCWRGGLRSQAVAMVCQLMSIPVYRLEGGYKAYRRLVYNYLWNQELRQEVVVLHGLTGVGKTEILQELKKRKKAAIDLEELASNRGSVFGEIGMPPSVSQKVFEARLAQELWAYEKFPYLVVECESRKVGKVILPAPLFQKMQCGRRILVYDRIENRVHRLAKIYLGSDSEKEESRLLRAIESLKDRLGKERTEQLKLWIKAKEYEKAIRELLISYYDPVYRYPAHPHPDYDLSVDGGCIEEAVERIEEYLAQIYQTPE